MTTKTSASSDSSTSRTAAKKAPSKKTAPAVKMTKNPSKTYLAKPGDVQKRWWLVDADGQNLGRMCTEIAQVLRGKRKPEFTPHEDVGDFVIVVNAEKIVMTGNKFVEKKYYRHSRFFGSMKSKSAQEMRDDDPTFIIEDAVKGMLPNNKLAATLLLKLKAYKGPNHPHSAQKPEALVIQR
jgi:large subunit ribosomal protein L13